MLRFVSLLTHRLPATRWGPALLWMAGIFYFSSRPNPLSFVPSTQRGASIDAAAHFAEYAGLLLLLYRALSNNNKGHVVTDPSNPPGPSVPHNPGITTVSGRRAAVGDCPLPILNDAYPEPNRGIEELVEHHPMLAAFAITLTYAILDEFHQQLVPDRGFELLDIGYDLIGIATATGLIWIHGRLRLPGADGPGPGK